MICCCCLSTRASQGIGMTAWRQSSATSSSTAYRLRWCHTSSYTAGPWTKLWRRCCRECMQLLHACAGCLEARGMWHMPCIAGTIKRLSCASMGMRISVFLPHSICCLHLMCCIMFYCCLNAVSMSLLDRQAQQLHFLRRVQEAGRSIEIPYQTCTRTIRCYLCMC